MTVESLESGDVLADHWRAGGAVTIVSSPPEPDRARLTVTYELIRRQTARVTFIGELEGPMVQLTREALLVSLTWAIHWIEVDAGALESCDSHGLGMLLEFDRRCSQRAGRLRVVSARNQLIELLHRSGESMLVTRLGTLIG